MKCRHPDCTVAATNCLGLCTRHLEMAHQMWKNGEITKQQLQKRLLPLVEEVFNYSGPKKIRIPKEEDKKWFL